MPCVQKCHLKLFLLVWLVATTAWSGQAHARDVRVALLVANQQGWKKDPKLRYSLQGDLRPMARTLKRLGFEIVGQLENKGPDALRRAFQLMIQRLRQKPKVTTFFFYYSGHADKHYFHMGPRKGKPLHFKEFVQFLDKIKIKRRFGVIDACFSGEVIRQFGALRRYRNLVDQGLLKKGVLDKLEQKDISKHLPHQGENAASLQLLSSSRQLSFESQQLKGSVFTHFILKGLKGKADLNQDGKISFNELFMYAKPRVRTITGQDPQQWLFRMGGGSYSFAPVYRSQLHIGRKILGDVSIVVGNFLWNKRKEKSIPMRIAVIPGPGVITLRHKGKCWKQRLHFPLGGVATLQRDKQVSCRLVTLRSKSGITLPSQRLAYNESHQPQWELQMGAWGTSGVLGPRGDLSVGGLLGLRLGYIGVLLGAWGTSQGYTDGTYQHSLFELRIEAGYRKRWGAFDLFAGAYVSSILLLQDFNRTLRPGFALQFGLTSTAAFFITPHIGLLVALDLGALPAFIQDQTIQVHWIVSARAGVRFLL